MVISELEMNNDIPRVLSENDRKYIFHEGSFYTEKFDYFVLFKAFIFLFIIFIFALFAVKFGPDNTLENLRSESLFESFSQNIITVPGQHEAHINPSIFTESPDKVKEHQTEIFGHPLPVLKPDYEKANKVKEGFKNAYDAYRKYAWGKDFLRPDSKSGTNHFNGGLSITDSLDTMVIMNLIDEFSEAVAWVEKNFTMNGSYSVFEAVIRHLGGLISAYELTGDPVLLDKARYMGDSLLPVFDQETGFFSRHFHVHNDRASNSSASSGCLAELGSVQMEFYSLSMLTKNPVYAQYASKIHRTIFKNYQSGLLPEHISARGGGKYSGGSLDAGSDSYFEYLLKLYLMTGCKIRTYLDHYLLAIKDTKERILKKFGSFTAITREGGRQMSHLVTFAAGMFALGAIKENPHAEEDLRIADQLADTYVRLYKYFPSGLIPEIVAFEGGDKVRMVDSTYKLRPETVESLYVLYRMTGLPKYREQAWEIFLSIEKNCKVVSGGYTQVSDCDKPVTRHDDFQDSYFLAETLKYLYLIFQGSDVLPTDKWIFNTEAHPLRLWTDEEYNAIKDAIVV